MSTLYRRERSPFWWLAYFDKTGKRRQISTKIRAGDAAAYRRAVEFQNMVQTREKRVVAGGQDWSEWVPQFIEARYASAAKTRSRVAGVWRTLQAFFIEHKIKNPAEVTREHCFQFMAWRKAAGMFKGVGGKPIRHNTVLYDLKILRVILNEALDRGLIASNPASRLKMKKERDRVKDEFTDEHIAKVRRIIADKIAKAAAKGDRAAMDNADFLHVSFEIALHQCCRLSETCFPIKDVDFAGGSVVLLAKGGENYTAPLNPGLVPLLKGLRAEKKTYTYKQPHHPSLLWFKFFDDLRKEDDSFDNISFHSLRVTGISRLERAGVPETVVMRLVNHSSTLVHRIYRRMNQSEIGAAWASLQGSYAPPTDGTSSPPSTGGHGKASF